ncbi:MAG: SUMF1/EgtB/PvdO family nonheme iron enzyme [Thermoguttaceae bacterium]|nr:SUMF1/EgtB/PvdO family nonheme iron enzyme [Thermoguttaceae bacterium]
MDIPDALPFQTEVSSLMQKLHQAADNDAPLQMPLTIGQYCLIRFLGRGGMGDVYEAENLALKRREAIKFVRSRLILNPQALARFQTEIESTAKLQSSNIVSVYNAGQFEGRPYMVMEYLDGNSVHQYVRHRIELGKPLSVDEAVEIVTQAARGLQYAHEKGFIHRDVKPGNLWITPDKTVKVLDLGLAIAMARDADGVQIVGTPDFMPPEQCSQSGIADPRSDIYSLGCTLFYILTGVVPFGGKDYSSSEKKMEAQRTRSLPPLSQFRKGVPAHIQNVLNRMTAKDAAKRYSSMAEVIEALKPNSFRKPFTMALAGAIALAALASWAFNSQPTDLTNSGDNSKNVSVSDVKTEAPVQDVIAPFPTGKQAGEKLVRVVDGVEYVFRWCPPGSFLMGNDGVVISKDMTIDQLMDIAKSNRLLPDDKLADFEKRMKINIPNSPTQSIDQEMLLSDLYFELTWNPKVNTDSPPQKVAIPNGFWTLDCEVTQKMWFSVMPNSPANNAIRSFNNSENSPVRNVTWEDAQEFCKQLAKKLKVNVELLSEEQWEYACRAGGAESSETCAQQAVSFEDFLTVPALARCKSPNSWGIYDMPGNVKEWCSNDYKSLDESKTPAENSQKPIKTIRGGSYLEQIKISDFCSVRDYRAIDSRDVKVGFRICVPKKGSSGKSVPVS